MIELMVYIIVIWYINQRDIKSEALSYADYKYQPYIDNGLHVSDEYNFVFKLIGNTKYKAVFGILQANAIRKLTIREWCFAILKFGLYIDSSAYNPSDLVGKDLCYISSRVWFVIDSNQSVISIYDNGVNRKLICNENKLALFLGLTVDN